MGSLLVPISTGKSELTFTCRTDVEVPSVSRSTREHLRRTGHPVIVCSRVEDAMYVWCLGTKAPGSGARSRVIVTYNHLPVVHQSMLDRGLGVLPFVLMGATRRR